MQPLPDFLMQIDVGKVCHGHEIKSWSDLRCVCNDELSLVGVLTLPFSSRFVSMTMVADPCSHTMRQKSGTESGTGPGQEKVLAQR